MKLKEEFLVLFLLLSFSAVSLSENIVSRPVGFVRIEIPPREQVLVSTPFNAFDESINFVLKKQLTGSLDEDTADHVYKWDGSMPSYISAVKIDGTGDEALDGKWVINFQEMQSSDMKIKPGEGIVLDNRQPTNQCVYLSGRVMLSDQTNVLLTAPLTAIGYPYSTAINIEDTGLAGSSLQDGSTMLRPGKGYWHLSSNEYNTIWTEIRPYENNFPGESQLPAITGIEVGEDGQTIELTIECASADQVLDVFYKDMDLSNPFDSLAGWRLAETELYVGAEGIVNWVDSAHSARPMINEVPGRYYLVGRADIDSDGDGIPDARELFVNQTDPYAVYVPQEMSEIIPHDEMTFLTNVVNGTNVVTVITSNLAQRRPPEILVGRIIYVDRKIGGDNLSGQSPVVIDQNGPKQTITAGLKEVRSGDTLIIKGGRYGEDLKITGKNIKVRLEGAVDLVGNPPDMRAQEPIDFVEPSSEPIIDEEIYIGPTNSVTQ